MKGNVSHTVLVFSATLLIMIALPHAAASTEIKATAVLVSTSTTSTSTTTTSSTLSTSTSSSTTTKTTTTIPYCPVGYGPWGWFSGQFDWFSGRFGWFWPFKHQNCIPTTSTSTSTFTTTIPPVNTGLGTPIVSPPSPTAGSGFTISCPAKDQNFNCINAYANGLQNECTWIKWSGDDAIFDCAGMPAGTYTAECEAIPDTDNHCLAASTTLSYSVTAPTTTVPPTTTINPCHYWDGKDYDGCSPLTTESTTVSTTTTKTTTKSTTMPTTTKNKI